MVSAMRDIGELTDRLRDFAAARDWEQFHTPKNLVMALAGEAGELVAEFQWLTPAEAAAIMTDPQAASQVGPRSPTCSSTSPGSPMCSTLICSALPRTRSRRTSAAMTLRRTVAAGAKRLVTAADSIQDVSNCRPTGSADRLT
jgi:hypothetical protein